MHLEFCNLILKDSTKKKTKKKTRQITDAERKNKCAS